MTPEKQQKDYDHIQVSEPSGSFLSIPLNEMPPEGSEEFAALRRLEGEILRILCDIQSGELILTPSESTDSAWCTIRRYEVSNGWKFFIFDDCGEWDYIDSFQRPEDEEQIGLWRFLDAKGPWSDWVDAGGMYSNLPEPEIPFEVIRKWQPEEETGLKVWGY